MLKSLHPIWFFIAALIAFRLVTLAMFPLLDTTEARYGEIARIMIETNNWVTPQFDYNVPFWGKPPLHTWASAISGKLFGVSELSLRLPHLLTGIVTLVIVGMFANRLKLSVPVTSLILTSSLGFITATGMIMTDSLLLLSMTMAMVGFYLSWRNNTRAYAYLGFIGIGIGLLAKGPIIIILITLAIVPWVFINYGVYNGITIFYRRIPLVRGLAIIILLALPWYYLAEKATPGFINYFLVGEHFLRFVQSGWVGDLYGTAHSKPRGIIWLYWVVIAFPWSLYLFAMLFSKNNRNKLTKERMVNTENGYLTSFLVCWLISPMILFTLSGNILPIYVLPGIPALAMLIAKLHNRVTLALIVTSAVTPIALIGYLFVVMPSVSVNKSDKFLIADVDHSYSLYYLGKRSFSARFYSQGKAKEIIDLSELKSLKTPFYIALSVTVNYKNQIKLNCESVNQNKHRRLLLCQT